MVRPSLVVRNVQGPLSHQETALAVKIKIAASLVPTLRVGTQVPTLCVARRRCAGRLPPRVRRDAERPDLRSHAERGNEGSIARRKSPTILHRGFVKLITKSKEPADDGA